MHRLSLYDEQSLFALALREGSAKVDTARLFDGSTQQCEAGLAVYRRNHDAAVCGALRAAYPIVRALVGDAFFDEAARQYALTYPSGSGDLHLLGAHFASFLLAYAPAGELPYLPRVARLEWALLEAEGAADAPRLDAQRFAAQLQHSPAHLRPRLHPAVQLVRSPFPIDDIWRFHQPGAGEVTPDWSQGQAVVVYRPEWHATVRLASPAEAAALAAARDGRTLEEVLSAALQAHADADLHALLVQWLNDGLLTQLELDPLEG